MAEGTIALLSFVLTLMVFSYVLGDLPLVGHLYRTAVYIFVGMSAAFATIVAYESVILPYLQDIQNPETSWTMLGNSADAAIFATALLFGLLLLLKPIASLSWLTNSALAVVIVVSAATAVVGGLSGTLIPLVVATAAVPDGLATDFQALINTLLVFVGTMTALFYFQWQARRDDGGAPVQSPLSRGLRNFGKIFIVTALGAIYATTMLSALTILAERIGFLFQFGS
ncbi:MAG: hypothetical protein OXN94_04040 [Chloroflexota bacterium]|nr:hypothetical protein [Chloroflexota bacterium]MDE2951964.1 hypothetical protein [Chloroflexota bacterium]